MKIEPLIQHLHLFRQVANLKFQAFSYLTGGDTIEDYLQRQQGYISPLKLPKAYVALNNKGELLGSFTLKTQDLKERPELSPWLGSLVVAPPHRCQGVGTYMVQQGTQFIKAMNHSNLYLYTPGQKNWYAKQGWHAIEERFLNNFPITVMVKKIQ